MAVSRGREGRETLPETAPAPFAYSHLGVGILARSIAVPALGLGVTVTCRVGRVPTPRTVRGLVDGGALAVTRPALLLPAYGLVAPGRCLRAATGIAECARAFGVTARGLDECARNLLAVARPGDGSRYRSRDRRWSRDRSPSSDRSRSGKRSWRSGWGHWDRAEAAVASRDRGDSGLTVAPAPAVAGGATALPTSSFPDLVRLVFSLSGSVEQRGVVLGSLFSSAVVTDAGGVPAPAAPVPTAAAISCSPSVPAPGGLTSAGAASATASHGRCERAQESSRPERRHGRSTGRERSRSGGKLGKGRSPSPACSAHSASASACSSSESSVSEGRASALPPPPASRSGAGGGRSKYAHSAHGRARSPLPGPLGLSSDVRAALLADRSRLGLHGLSLPAPSGVAEEDCDNISGSFDLDRDDSFRSVLHLIRGLEEPASVASNRCKTSLAPIYGLQSRVPGSAFASFPLA